MKLLITRSALMVLALAVSVKALADGGTDNAYSPYSKFGIGILNRQGTSYNWGMGGVGIASRDNRYLNILNPAAVTSRDSLAFMAEFGVIQTNNYYKEQFYDGHSLETLNNTFNIGNLAMSFPIWRSSAFMVGISPFSSVGYDFATSEQNDYVVGETGNITDAYTGFGSIYQAYVSAGATFWKRFSVGAQFIFFFGNLEKSNTRSFTSTSYRSIYFGNQMNLYGFSGKFGLQYEQPIGKDRLTVGATYRLASTLKGNDLGLIFTTQSAIIDTIKTVNVGLDNISIPDEISVGISYKHKQTFSAEFDYSFSDWTNSSMSTTSGFSSEGFDTRQSHNFNLGFEYTPNRNDIRYYMKRCSYRVGAYYSREYYAYSGRQVESSGVTLGFTFPIYKWYNALTLGIDVGHRGNLRDVTPTYSPIREIYFGFAASFNIFDIWFIKPKYE